MLNKKLTTSHVHNVNFTWSLVLCSVSFNQNFSKMNTIVLNSIQCAIKVGAGWLSAYIPFQGILSQSQEERKASLENTRFPYYLMFHSHSHFVYRVFFINQRAVDFHNVVIIYNSVSSAVYIFSVSFLPSFNFIYTKYMISILVTNFMRPVFKQIKVLEIYFQESESFLSFIN